MTKHEFIHQAYELRCALQQLDARYREITTVNRTPTEIANTLKHLRMLTLSIESGGLDACFNNDGATK